MIVRVASLIGRNLFHVKYIKLSYRIRGSVARIQINKVASNIVFVTRDRFDTIGMSPKKNTDVRSLIIKMLAYSAIKIRANIPPLYSTLNPDTSSDSPSAKSNGVRFVSAKLVINQKMNIIDSIKAGHDIILIDMRDMSIFL